MGGRHLALGDVALGPLGAVRLGWRRRRPYTASMDPSLSALRFASLVADLEVDDQRRAERMARTRPSARCYIVMFSARSGSTWLTSILAATQRLGFPHEYINPSLVRQTAEELDAKTPHDVIAMLRRAKQSRNGVFGLKARAVDIDLFGADIFADAFAPTAIFFHLWRQNLVAQGASLYRAVATRRYHAHSVSTVTEPPSYDADQLINWTRHVAATENANARLLHQRGIPARHLTYEGMIADRAVTVGRFAHALGVPLTTEEVAASGKDVSKIGDSWNIEVEQRVRRDRAAQILEIETGRLVKHGVHGARPYPMPAEPRLQQSWHDGRERGRLGRSPLMNPFEPAQPEYGAWASGWRDGWDDQRYLQPSG
jgi:LPS sulfotransferase NodH